MEKSPSERKPNRAFRGRIIKAAIAEALDLVRKPTLPPIVEIDPVGIGTTTEMPNLRFEDHFPNNWEVSD